MNRERLKRKYELATSDTYSEIRAEALNYVVKISSSTVSPVEIQGMLVLISEIDSWVNDYEKELAKRKEQLNGK